MAGLLPGLPGRGKRERLPRPGLAGHDHDPPGGAADVVDHLLLLAYGPGVVISAAVVQVLEKPLWVRA